MNSGEGHHVLARPIKAHKNAVRFSAAVRHSRKLLGPIHFFRPCRGYLVTFIRRTSRGFRPGYILSPLRG